MELVKRLATAGVLTDLGAVRVRPARCPVCGPSLLVRLSESEWAIRCVRCRAAPAILSLVAALQALRPRLERLSVYELSARGPLNAYLRRRSGRFTCSEFLDDVAPGAYVDGVLCQDVQALTFADASFDLCTSTEVFEHVPDDGRGFAELCRVLKPGGLAMFTVPMRDASSTLVRAELVDGKVIHHLAPEYHGDRLRGQGQVLAFRHYGRDVVERLTAQGFARAEIVVPADPALWWGSARPVVVAQKAPERPA
jgi:SAM-dependent methyltransferase